MKTFKISVVIPAYNEEMNINELIKNILPILDRQPDYEIVFVDDGSTDNTLSIIKKLHNNNPRIKFLSFSRNFGKENAIKCGLDNANGSCIIVMDSDLQHPPEIIPVLIKKWKEGYEIVYAAREYSSQTPLIRRKATRIFLKLMNKLSDISLDKRSCDFFLLDKKVVDEIKRFNESFLFIRGMLSWIGFKSCSISFSPNQRHTGVSKFNLKNLFLYGINCITSFTVKPLHLSTILGLIISIFASVYIIYAIIVSLFTEWNVPGWASILVSVLFLGGIQLIMLGIVGEYLGKTFIESKKRPIYIIKEKKIN